MSAGFYLFIAFIFGIVFDIILSHLSGGSRDVELRNELIDMTLDRDNMRRLIDTRPLINDNLVRNYILWNRQLLSHEAEQFKAVKDQEAA